MPGLAKKPCPEKPADAFLGVGWTLDRGRFQFARLADFSFINYRPAFEASRVGEPERARACVGHLPAVDADTCCQRIWASPELI